MLAISLCAARPAQAGIPECGDLRLEDVGSCELRGDLACNAGCSELGVFEKACATKLHTVCRSECTFAAQPSCTDSCTEVCSRDCDRGVNVICSHNCFAECAGGCDAHCASIGDEAQCRASCEATCDGECDIKCRPVIDGSCYQHCVECCGGTCTAQANMDCQTTCQEESFEQCEYGLEADCSAECSGSGAIFCDGAYVLGGEAIPACAQKLLERGIAELDFEVHGGAELGAAAAAGTRRSRVSCQATMLGTTGGGAAGAFLLLLGLALARRRR